MKGWSDKSRKYSEGFKIENLHPEDEAAPAQDSAEGGASADTAADGEYKEATITKSNHL